MLKISKVGDMSTVTVVPTYDHPDPSIMDRPWSTTIALGVLAKVKSTITPSGTSGGTSI